MAKNTARERSIDPAAFRAIGQAFGSAVGGVLFAAERHALMGPLAALFMLAGMALLISTSGPLVSKTA